MSGIGLPCRFFVYQKVTFNNSPALNEFEVTSRWTNGYLYNLVDVHTQTKITGVHQAELAPYPLYKPGQMCQYGPINRLRFSAHDGHWWYFVDSANDKVREDRVVLKE